MGGEAKVLSRTQSGTNEFGNTTESIDRDNIDRTVITFQTYPNRNTSVESSSGVRHQDRPVFLVPNTDDQPEPPQEGEHMVYDGNEYEVKAHTEYQTHVEFFGEPVIHDT